MKIWQKRLFELECGELKYFNDDSAAAIKSLNLAALTPIKDQANPSYDSILVTDDTLLIITLVVITYYL